MPRPNLDRISGADDWLAEKVLNRVKGHISPEFVDSLDSKSRLALGRYGIRAVTVALRANDSEVLREALFASAITGSEPRDTMIGLALHFVCAEMIGVSLPALFDEVAERIEAFENAALLRTFGSRNDVTLEAFHWSLVETPSGPDFEPFPWHPRHFD